MKILKVIVDELPEHGCQDCILGDDEYEMCCATEEELEREIGTYKLKNYRPPSCPLILEEDVETWLMTRPQKPKYVLCDNKD